MNSLVARTLSTSAAVGLDASISVRTRTSTLVSEGLETVTSVARSPTIALAIASCSTESDDWETASRRPVELWRRSEKATACSEPGM